MSRLKSKYPISKEFIVEHDIGNRKMVLARFLLPIILLSYKKKRESQWPVSNQECLNKFLKWGGVLRVYVVGDLEMDIQDNKNLKREVKADKLTETTGYRENLREQY